MTSYETADAKEKDEMTIGKIEYSPDYKSNKFRDFLTEQMKDPEFVAAYEIVSDAEDKRLAEIRLLERKVIEAAKELKRLAALHARYVAPSAIADAAVRYRKAETELFTWTAALESFEANQEK